MKWSIFSASAIHARFMEHTPDKPEEMIPAPLGVATVIPLDKDDPTYDRCKKCRDDLDEGPDPGGLPPQGIHSFFRSPAALTPSDLRAGQSVYSL